MVPASFSLPHTMSVILNNMSVVVELVVMSLNVNAPSYTGREIMLLAGVASARTIICAVVSSTLSLNSGDLSSRKLSL
jgi:hypothetical protein